MKRILFPIVALCLMASCKSLETNIAPERLQAAADGRNFAIDITDMYPMRGPGKYVGSDFFLRVSGDSVSSYLPYFGRAYRVSYDGSNPLDFDGPMLTYATGEGKRGASLVEFSARSEHEILVYRVAIYTNGEADIDVSSNNRDFISYKGRLRLTE